MAQARRRSTELEQEHGTRSETQAHRRRRRAGAEDDSTVAPGHDQPDRGRTSTAQADTKAAFKPPRVSQSTRQAVKRQENGLGRVEPAVTDQGHRPKE